MERQENPSSYTSVVPKMVPIAVQQTQVKSEAMLAANKRRCACLARNLEPKFKHSNL